MFDAAVLYRPLPEGSFFALLAEHGDRVVRDEDFVDCYSSGMGRPSIPPSLLAKVMLLQHRTGVSDEQAMECVAWDLRWKVALGLPVDHQGWHPTSLTKYRARLLLHKKEGLALENTLRLAEELGMLNGSAEQIGRTPFIGPPDRIEGVGPPGVRRRAAADGRPVSRLASEQPVEVFATNPRRAEDVAKRALLDRPAAVDRHRDRVGDARMAQDVMAAADALHVPALAFEELEELLAGDGRSLAHVAWTATRSRCTVGMGRPSSCMTSRYPSIASWAFARASSIVSPCVATLGNSGTNTL